MRSIDGELTVGDAEVVVDPAKGQRHDVGGVTPAARHRHREAVERRQPFRHVRPRFCAVGRTKDAGVRLRPQRRRLLHVDPQPVYFRLADRIDVFHREHLGDLGIEVHGCLRGWHHVVRADLPRRAAIVRDERPARADDGVHVARVTRVDLDRVDA